MLARRPLVSFFVLAYLGSWLCWAPLVLMENGAGVVHGSVPAGPAVALNTLALFMGPFLAALVMTKVTQGRVAPLLRRMVQVRGSALGWVIALVVLPVVLAVAVLLGPVGHPTFPGAPAGAPTGIVAAIAFLPALLAGPIQEEPGWRGFALPRMQQAMHPVTAALVLGLLWGMWHLPQFLIRAWDTPHENMLDVLGFLCFTVAASVVMSWVSNLGRAGVLIAILAHNVINWTLTCAPIVLGRAVPSMWQATVPLALLALVGVAVTRGRLAVDHVAVPQEEPRREPALAVG